VKNIRNSVPQHRFIYYYQLFLPQIQYSRLREKYILMNTINSQIRLIKKVSDYYFFSITDIIITFFICVNVLPYTADRHVWLGNAL